MNMVNIERAREILGGRRCHGWSAYGIRAVAKARIAVANGDDSAAMWAEAIYYPATADTVECIAWQGINNAEVTRAKWAANMVGLLRIAEGVEEEDAPETDAAVDDAAADEK